MRGESDSRAGLAVCLLVRSDEPLLLRPWVLYHAGLVGLQNLHLIVPASSTPEVLDRLAALEALGVDVHRLDANPGKPEAIDACLRDLARTVRSKLLILLETTEFLIYNGPQGVGCRRSWIREEIARLATTGVGARTEWDLQGQPGRLDVFRCVQRRRRLFRIAGVTGTNPVQESAAPVANAGDVQTALQVLCLRRMVPGVEDSAFREGESMVRIAEFERTLRALDWAGELAGPGFAKGGEDPAGKWLLDLDRTRFVPGAYLDANPSVKEAGIDALAHFLFFGLQENRRLRLDETSQELFDRLAEQRRVQPDGTVGYRGLAAAARHSGRLEEAETIVREALDRFGPSPTLLREHASLASCHRSPSEQVRRWERYRLLAPYAAEGYSGLASGCRLAGDGARARTLVDEGLARHPNVSALREIASRLDEDDAMCRHAGVVNILQLRRLLQRFESLGWSCEFGSVHRRFGIESLGLLRFSNMHAVPLARALQDRFVGFAEPEQTVVVRAISREFWVKNARYDFLMHTHIYGDESQIPELQARMRRQLAFRREKLLDDLCEGEKIFVHLCSPLTTQDQLDDLVSAFREASRARLLCVKVGGTEQTHGTVTELLPGILMGVLSRRGLLADSSNIDFACWVRLCAAAAAHFDQRDATGVHADSGHFH